MPDRYVQSVTPGTAWSDGGRCVLVVGAHPGAGVSTIAVAVAEALAVRVADDAAAAVRLVDGASPDTSGLMCAADREQGLDPSGWRVGSRRGVEILRPADVLSSPADVPALPGRGSGWVVVDAGWSLRDLLGQATVVGSLLATARVVLVCRGTVPGVRRAELALGQLPTQPLVVVVGSRRLPGVVWASFGPALRCTDAEGRLLVVPADRRLEVAGIDDRSLPKALTVAAARLVDQLVPELLETRTHRPEVAP